MLREYYLCQSFLKVGYMFFNAAFNAAGYGVVQYRVGREQTAILIPVAIIDGVAIANKQILNLQAVGNLLQRKSHVEISTQRGISAGLHRSAWQGERPSADATRVG